MSNYQYCVTVLTPVYNRVHLLPRLFGSMRAQTDQNFQWLVIDDGSTEETEAFFDALPAHTFELEYHRKANGGRYSALNYAHPYIKGELVLFLDNDDYLLPEAIATITKEWPKYDRPEIGCISYHRQAPDGHILSVKDEQDEVISDHITYRVNGRRWGDRCEVLRTDILKNLPFPVFEGERFTGDGWLWNHVAYDYKTVYRNIPLSVCEYQQGGMSDLGRAMFIRSPYGRMENCRSFFVDKTCARIKCKERLLYFVYGKFGKMSAADIIRSSGQGVSMVLTAPFGYLLYFYWKWKYMRER